MINIFFDSETTGINPYVSEVIEMYFHVNDEMNYHYKARPFEWSHEAEVIHKISYAQAMTYPDKMEALTNFIEWLKQFKKFRFINYANKNTQLGYINFDVAILENELNLVGYPFYFLQNKLGMKKAESVYYLAKECAKLGLFTPIKNTSGRDSFSQENVFKALFKSRYNAHNCVDDVLALVRIRAELLRLFDEDNTKLFWH
jgi:DNA polymerase elongation subunit (family B)